MKSPFLLILLLSNLAFISDSESKCDDNLISHCSKCSTGEDSDTCATCDDKYFPFLSNLICLPCNDSLYGQIGCAGKCDGSDFMNDHFVSCEKGTCKEGFYDLNGICTNCSMGSPGCKKCTYEVNEEGKNGLLFVQNVKVMNIYYRILANVKSVIII